MTYIAHIRESDSQVQTVEEHLLGVKELAETYGEKIGIKHLAGLAGMLHDLGKYTNEFREYILEAVNNPNSSSKRGSVDHSTAGGKLLYQLFHTENIIPYKGILSEIVGNAIISHHGYLQDFLNPDLESPYLNRVRDKKLSGFDVTQQFFFKHVMSERVFHEYVDKATEELESFLRKESPENTEKQLMFLTKFIFSTLIDADRTNTRLFEEEKSVESVLKSGELFEIYYERLMSKINSFKKQQNANTPINILRTEMSEQCDQFAERASGIYTLSIPTGGGKTLASLRYALKHAKIHNKKRIIYVVPYTTIIEQNAEEVRRILEDEENILEHHSNIVEEVNDNDENEDGMISVQQKLKLAKDNWESPIIFTTMVQFLNVFYATGNRNTRRLHNLSEAIIIFDEVQKVPISCVSLFNQALNFLKVYSRSSIVLCTATQPALDFVEQKLDVNTDAEMINNLDNVIESFKRVEIIDKATIETFNKDKLTTFIHTKIEEVQSILIVLNTKSVVRDLYTQLLSQRLNIPIYHLSTTMCAAHRHKILEEVRKCLKDGRKIICISTQLIEAGVDVSFECVIRSLSGLDSIAQAAGRCNRHGEKDIQNVYVIDYEEENLSRLKEIKIGKKITKKILEDLKRNNKSHGGHILSREAMKRYFKEYYTEFESDLNYFIPKLKKNMTELLSAPRIENSYRRAYIHKHTKKDIPLFILNSYQTAAKHFNVIDDLTTSVIVPYEEGKGIIAELNSNSSIEDLSRLLRKAQQYTVNLFNYEKEQLIINDGLVYYLDGEILALKEGAYNDEYGLNLLNESDFKTAIF
ncbi:CRISPR-associated helicase/endonuclease Cas3 [Bacillus thuringiensis]|uniref:CRISPR-associated helicase/endonuclease Cas3 n=1 Tax=Bacillus thuringiensis TaxID=1428 RepID=A0ABD6RU01_BACTU|nr:CRISPR-associated helicase/endonuclease Cas3 [Bacillus thuringiensis]PER38991.1 CRISPR-associated helicase/endonuclease Cas3 [Bacillus thuringiensis]PEU81943.1 CRISPR-associated helicase/endonuclease Cas3 [Bacillus thuringiensis]PFI04025.1 CRISPR-associated helicase/endonuclease Cas3 [Bacillus thuringiensis]PFW18151.1 CRISPR-associated helicase/endonuclease Cas3 [Bacillus thuringiensis]PGY73662.1 CRISPR-associated helicase/endonuclease Cas3 [Bacillus thuringiensis]